MFLFFLLVSSVFEFVVRFLWLVSKFITSKIFLFYFFKKKRLLTFLSFFFLVGSPGIRFGALKSGNGKFLCETYHFFLFFLMETFANVSLLYFFVGMGDVKGL